MQTLSLIDNNLYKILPTKVKKLENQSKVIQYNLFI